MMNNNEYYVIFYDNIQLTNDDQNRYKMLRIVSNVVDFERETKSVFDDRVSHNMKIFINKIKKNVTVFASHKKVFTSIKKNQIVFSKNVAQIAFNKNRQQCFQKSKNFSKRRKLLWTTRYLVTTILIFRVFKNVAISL